MPAKTQLKKGLRKKALQRIAPHYAMLFFDHLYSEYLALRPLITSPATVELLEGLHEKRLRCELTWSDIYSFDLTLVQSRPLKNLIRKAYDILIWLVRPALSRMMESKTSMRSQ
jgi:hypothetical protein